MIVGREVEGERVIGARRAEPGEAVFAPLDVGCEFFREAAPNDTVDAVGADDEIGIDIRQIADVVAEFHFNPEFGASALKNLQQFHPSAAAESMAGRPDRFAVEDEIDLVPIGELVPDRVIALRIADEELVERLVRKNHAEAERIGRRIPLVYRYVIVRECFFCQQREVEAARPAADHRNAHRRPLRYLSYI